jgi:hypothetical protein
MHLLEEIGSLELGTQVQNGHGLHPRGPSRSGAPACCLTRHRMAGGL